MGGEIVRLKITEHRFGLREITGKVEQWTHTVEEFGDTNMQVPAVVLSSVEYRQIDDDGMVTYINIPGDKKIMVVPLRKQFGAIQIEEI